ncbi:aquaporin AQPAe.a-like [Schistocerca serialis cubense]|uniref:aquaporin AQPAe.a-like n=1 Tax=Schistocerca serialis cubense TaxID=2023355 RepID=UPI00214E640E|nr:aquaporin AQPAe.a-like [Schistocerca serialis cubense]
MQLWNTNLSTPERNVTYSPIIPGAWAAAGLHEVEVYSTTWRKFAAEFIGTFLLVLVGCGSTTVAWSEGYKPTTVQISLAFGLIVACVVQCLGHVSGAHVNPAVTVGLLSAGHVFLLRAVMYIAAQCAGAIAAAVVLKALTPEESESTLGVTAVSPHLTLTQAVFVEAFITFFLVMTVFGARSARGSAGFAIGLSITTCHLFAMQYTGASMNPARSLGPAMVTGVWHNHWVYWMGPLAGGIAAGAMSSCLFRPSVPKAPVRPTRDSEHRPLLS